VQNEFFLQFFEKKDWFCLQVQKKALPLHSLSGSNAVTAVNDRQAR
jgi:hypothetical protein